MLGTEITKMLMAESIENEELYQVYVVVYNNQLKKLYQDFREQWFAEYGQRLKILFFDEFVSEICHPDPVPELITEEELHDDPNVPFMESLSDLLFPQKWQGILL